MLNKNTKWLERIARTTVFLILTLCLTSLGIGMAAEKGTIKIGWAGGLTGPLAQVVQDAKQGSDVAAEEINAAGGVLGQRVELIYADTKIDPQLARQAIQRMVYSDRVVAIIGDYFSPNTMAAMDIAQENQIPMISANSGLTAITRSKNGFISRVVSSTEDFTRALGTYALETLKFKRFVVFTTSDSFGRDAGDSFAEFVKKRGAQVVGYEIYDRATTRDFTNLLAKNKETPVDAFFLGGAQADSALITRQARQLGINTQLLGSFPVSKPPYYTIGGEVTQGTIAAANYIGLVANLSDFTEESTKMFVKKWETRFGKPPTDDHAYGYDTMKILALSIERARSLNGPAIQQSLLRTRDYPGALATISMAPNGDAIIPIYILKWRADGKLTVLLKQSVAIGK